jgi:hypothetical protein
MRKRLGFNLNGGECMVKRLRGTLAFLLRIAYISFPVYATEGSPPEVPADAIRVGCSVLFSKHGNVAMVRTFPQRESGWMNCQLFLNNTAMLIGLNRQSRTRPSNQGFN